MAGTQSLGRLRVGDKAEGMERLVCEQTFVGVFGDENKSLVEVLVGESLDGERSFVGSVSFVGEENLVVFDDENLVGLLVGDSFVGFVVTVSFVGLLEEEFLKDPLGEESFEGLLEGEETLKDPLGDESFEGLLVGDVLKEPLVGGDRFACGLSPAAAAARRRRPPPGTGIAADTGAATPEAAEAGTAGAGRGARRRRLDVLVRSSDVVLLA